MVKRLSHVRAAIGDVRRLREEIEKAERPDPRLERDLADAIAHLEAVKAKKKAKSKKKEVKGIRAELIEAEKEADQALKVETEAKRDTREPRRPPTRRDKVRTYQSSSCRLGLSIDPSAALPERDMFPTWKIRNRNAPSTKQI